MLTTATKPRSRALVRFLIVLAALAIPAAEGAAFAASVPTAVNYQGRLTDNSPQQIPVNGTANMAFSIWDQPSGGTQLWAEPSSGTLSLSVNNGIFNVILGANGVPLPPSVFAGGGVRYLEILVGGETLAPRQQISSVGYAARAERSADSDMLGGVAPAGWQTRVTGSCAAGTAMGTINTNGTVSCNATSSGSTGQSATTVYQTNAITPSNYAVIPGLAQTVNVPANSVVYIATDGNSKWMGGSQPICGLQITLFIDGVSTDPQGNKLVWAETDTFSGNGGYTPWAMSLTRTLTPGSHTIETRARLAASCALNIPSGGQLTVMILKL